MGFFVKLLLKAGVTLGVMYFGYNFILGGGMSNFQMPGMETVSDAAKGLKGLGNAVVKQDVTVYKWVDENGVTHFDGSAPMGQGGGYEKKVISSNTNVIQMQKKIEEVAEAGPRSQITRVGKAYTPEGIKGTIDDASNLKEQLEQQMLDRENMLNGLKKGKK